MNEQGISDEINLKELADAVVKSARIAIDDLLLNQLGMRRKYGMDYENYVACTVETAIDAMNEYESASPIKEDMPF